MEHDDYNGVYFSITIPAASMAENVVSCRSPIQGGAKVSGEVQRCQAPLS